jgi:hypothetical protein
MKFVNFFQYFKKKKKFCSRKSDKNLFLIIIKKKRINKNKRSFKFFSKNILNFFFFIYKFLFLK